MVANNASASSSTFSVPPRIEPQYVRIVGDSVGVVNLTPAALQSLADKLTHLLVRCSRMAQLFAVHSRHKVLRIEDFQQALNHLGIQAPIGTVVRHTPSMRQLSMPTGEQLYVREDADVDIQALAQPPQAKIPLKRHFRVHWINVDNQEEPPPEKKAKKLSQAGRFSSVDIPAALRKRVPTPSELAAPSVAFRLSSQGIPKKEQILVKPSYLEPLSVEQQIYLTEIVEACVGQDDKRRQQALQSLERDTGIQELLPRLSRMIYTSIRCNIVHRCLSMLIYVVRMMRAVATNKSVKLAEVLHEFLPSLLSCMVCRFVCTRPESDNHWALRDFAAKTLSTIIKDHGTKDTRRRVFHAVKKRFEDPSSSYSMIYGTIGTLLEFASPLELTRLHPRIAALLERTKAVATTSGDHLERIEAHKLHSALLKHEVAMRRLIIQASRREHYKGHS
ncbi:hypothetical protein Q1695_007173 [Nippostrongylus brasiliensis]|nr:hypothetical protein Q1695_007173 [Nippostrongylus brasiliensis]